MVLYFSGTGNSRYVAQRLAERLGDTLVSMGDCLRQGRAGDFTSEKPYVVVCPIYAWRVPRVVEDFLRAARLAGSREMYFVVTCGQEAGDAAKYAAALCREKGLAFRGLSSIVMPDNYLVLFPVPPAETRARMVKDAGPHIDAAGARIAAGEPLAPAHAGAADRVKSGPVNRLFYRFFVSAKGFYATGACVGCGRCADVCPLRNVRLAAERPVWGKDCTHCMACISVCPTRAIEYKKATKGKERHYIK